MKSIASIASAVGIIALLAGPPALAGSEYDYARVLESTPVYKQVRVSTPREECWTEQVRSGAERSSRSNTPALVSGVVGGAIGNAVGNNKSSKRVGAVVGAVLGHSIGRDIVAAYERPERERYRSVRHCETVNEYYHEERVVGYNVRYRYDGRDYSVRTDHDPGDRIRVRVSVEPVI